MHATCEYTLLLNFMHRQLWGFRLVFKLFKKSEPIPKDPGDSVTSGDAKHRQRHTPLANHAEAAVICYIMQQSCSQSV